MYFDDVTTKKFDKNKDIKSKNPYMIYFSGP